MRLLTISLFLGSVALAIADEGEAPADQVMEMYEAPEVAPPAYDKDEWYDNPKWHYETLCHNEVCSSVWEPVCGCTCDGIYCRTFENECYLRLYNCRNTPDYNFNRNGTCDSCDGWKPKKSWGEESETELTYAEK